MMRARNIKPGFFKNEDLADVCPPWGRLLFAGLWCLADKAGRLKDRPRLMKAEIFPYDSYITVNSPLNNRYLTINKILDELILKKFIFRYQVDGEKYLQIINFHLHQSPHHTEKNSLIPAPSDIHESLTVNPPLSNGENPPDSLIPDSLITDKAPPKKSVVQPAYIFQSKYVDVDEGLYQELAKDYPGLNEPQLKGELRKALAWCDDNPHRFKKTSKGKRASPKTFLKNWLNKVTVSSTPEEEKPKQEMCDIHPERKSAMKVGNKRLCVECKRKHFMEAP